jgi:hypothetical protein
MPENRSHRTKLTGWAVLAEEHPVGVRDFLMRRR